ncbi:hypothetical protein H5410_046394 [Solanum commersonii]|uniref:Uncharacterized protein n=1 Tax=Solanum commersonii TaxID=4109 RepID=A0A9J5XGC9_SOLCO|nr:hypothetical protein H5410_046394 [Solanum commersonii]
MKSARWVYVRIISRTLFGGILGFYLMHRAKLYYKNMWNKTLKKYEEDLKMKQIMETHIYASELSRDHLAR